MNKQREVIYGQRKQVLVGDDLSENIQSMIESLVDDALAVYCPKGKYPEEWDWDDLYAYIERKMCIRDSPWPRLKRRWQAQAGRPPHPGIPFSRLSSQPTRMQW